ncbi:helix-turn-helix transcriptional regulator [Paenibacillus antri]|uniref:Helix-turn-helix transcriptional regulator n=1 Tax=Paenibacillus antri TaxID=2582848 RepID=A0A5R9G3T6_9BACL|nr:metalloregulator ArsR/SmtB family transcription factor [Paenibacillus antri]TLS48966.1 helix-turn-helix transcriptional regulator [Paenibacillus antri]
MKNNTLFEMLAEPNRRAILERLRRKEHTVGELVAASGLSQPGVSKHLRLMREAGLVVVRRSGREQLYSLRPEPLRELDDWLQPYRRFWSSKLDRLERSLDEEAAGPASIDKDKE